MDGRFSPWRCHLIYAALAAGLLALAGRVAYLQRCRGAELKALAERQQYRKVLLPARPGNIFARTRGGCVVVAGSRQVPCCHADPYLLDDAELIDASAKAAAALGVPARDVLAALRARRNSRFVRLARDITPAQARAVNALKLRAVKVAYEWRRYYPNGAAAAHVLGFRQIDGAAAAGIELGADRWLKGRAGHKDVRSDAARRGTYARIIEYEPPVDGRHVVLTVDLMVQGFLEQAMAAAVREFGKTNEPDPKKATAAMGVVMDPRTGAILAMASLPTFDPNHYTVSRPEQRRNRAITDPYEPGSAFKPFVAVGAVQMARADLTTRFFCHHGTYHAVRGGVIRDFPGESFGLLPLTEIVIHSSNIGMAKVGELLGNDALYRIGWAFGFGRATGVELPGECPGRLVPPPDWTSYATRRYPFGQGPIVVTALQLATAFSAVANGGELLRPRIIERVTDARGRVLARGRRARVRRVLSPQVARRFIDEVLVQVVRRGTGRRCQLADWQAFGKTGTAQIAGRGGYEEREYTATFVAGAPARRPAVVCAISVYRPDYAKGHTGGKVAAPAVRETLERTLGYLDVPGEDATDVASRGEGRP